jgi:divinyl protochlorophyllide a 8-vinyl-reductase
MAAALPTMPAPGRIGPNAITRVAEVLSVRVGRAVTAQVFERAGLAHYLQAPPQAMVDETEVRRLHGVLRQKLGEFEARAVARAAGTRTADYLLAHRIPRPVQRLLKALPAPLAARLLLAAIARHAWTFAGSGHFNARCAWRQGPPVVLTIRDNPLCRGLESAAPACDYYAATFERLFGVLVHARSRVLETACEACGDAECRFEIRWRGSLPAATDTGQKR